MKVGDRLYSTSGWGTITSVSNPGIYPVIYRTDSGLVHSLTPKGKVYTTDKQPFVSYEEFTIELKRPRLELKVDDKIFVSLDGEVWFPRHFSHYSENDTVVCWTQGATSFSNNGTTTTWKYFKLEE